MDILLIFLTIVLSKSNHLNVHSTGFYASFAETIFKLWIVYKFPFCKMSLNFEIIFSHIASCSGVFCCNILKSTNRIKLKILNKFNQHKICLK